MCPVVKKVLIVTPSSLTNNWGKEFKKWLGRERIQYYIIDQNNKVTVLFFMCKRFQLSAGGQVGMGNFVSSLDRGQHSASSPLPQSEVNLSAEVTMYTLCEYKYIQCL